MSFVLERITNLTDMRCSTEDLRHWLGTYPWLIVLDGLDEVPATSNRKQVLEKIVDFWTEVATLDADVLVVATTRPQGYSEDFSPRFYSHRYLLPLSQTRALHYATRLAEAQYGTDPDRKARVLRRLKMACEQETTQRLMRSPLQVTIMATLVDRIGQPPQERWRLFQQYYEVIYQRETERDIPASRVLQQRKADVNAIHNRVGLLLQTESERAGATESQLPSLRFNQLVRARIAEEGHEGEQLESRANEITEAALNRLVFLVGLESDRIGFEIRSLQEFMAAEALMDGKEELVKARLEAIAPISHWRNVFLFAAGKCFAERQFLRDMIMIICLQLNEPENDKLAGTTLAGSRLALDILDDGVAREQPKYAKSLARLALRLMDIPDVGANTKLATTYDPLLDPLFREETKHRLEQKDFNQRIGAWTVLRYLVDHQVAWAQDLADARWPEDTEQQYRVLQLRRGYGDEDWVAKKLIQLIPKASPWKLLTIDGYYNAEHEKGQQAPDWYHAARTISPRYRFRGGTSFDREYKVVRMHFSQARAVRSLEMLFRPLVDSSWDRYSVLKNGWE